MLSYDEAIELEAELEARALQDASSSLLGFTHYTKPDFQTNFHNKVLCRKLDDWIEGKIRFLIVSMPPRHGKSELVSRRLPAYVFGKNPDAQIIGCSYGAELSSRMNRDVQRIIDSPEYHRVFPHIALNDSNVRTVAHGNYLRNSDMFEIVGFRGAYRSAGIGGGITGMGADYFIIDDPVKNWEEADSQTYRDAVWEWWTSVAYTRLEKGGRVLLTMTRWHEDDLAGRLLKAAKEDPDADQWEELIMPAIKDEAPAHELDPRAYGEALWPGKYDEERLKRIKASVGSRVWQALYQQRPTAAGGAIIKRDWIKFYKTLPDARPDGHVQSWDMTFKETEDGSFVDGQVWRRYGASVYLTDNIHDRMDFIRTLDSVQMMSAKHPGAARKLVEEKANGAAVINALKHKIPGLVPVKVTGQSKESRAHAVASYWQAGNVYLPHPEIAPWIKDWIEEIVTFPRAPNDDRVDSMTQALIDLYGAAAGEFSEDMIPQSRSPIRKDADIW